MKNTMKALLVLFALTTLAACGRVGRNGIDGVNGRDGINGTDGAQGPAGADGTAVTIVPLCPGVSNYGAFVEVGMCINGKLYGVYSANGGFLTLLSDGAYRSNAIGSACDLTVHGCTVTH